MSIESEILEIVGRCRRVGFEVETGSGRAMYAYRIVMPRGKTTLHRSPSDRNWKKAALRQLDDYGDFTRLEQEWIANDEKERQRKIADDRASSDRKAKLTAAKAATTQAALKIAAGPYGVRDVDPGWLLTPADVQETRTAQRITPELATKLLATINTANRKIKPGHVTYLVSVIRNDEWRETHQGMAIDSRGVLQDGQHRLLACVEADMPIVVAITVGVPPTHFGKVDVGVTRSARDLLALRGEVNVVTLTTAARLIVVNEMHGSETATRGRGSRLSIDRVDRAVDEYGDPLRNAVALASKIRRELKVNASGLAAAIYLIRRRLPEGDPRVETFFEHFESGIGFIRTDPVWVLRRLFIRASADLRHTYDQYESAAYVIKAWNLRAMGRQAQTLSWRRDEGFPDVFLPPPPEKP